MELVKQIAHYLLEVETLTKDEIDEIVKTGKLEWWDTKKTFTEETTKVEETVEVVEEVQVTEETEKQEDAE